MGRVVVAGLGNVFRRDDGFGVAVAQHLAAGPLPPGVELRDVGVRSLHLGYDLAGGCQVLVLVDALDLGEPAGTIAVVDPDRLAAPPVVDGHAAHPSDVLRTVEHLGGSIEVVRVVGCQPGSLDHGVGLTPAVDAAVAPAAALVLDVLDSLAVAR